MSMGRTHYPLLRDEMKRTPSVETDAEYDEEQYEPGYLPPTEHDMETKTTQAG